MAARMEKTPYRGIWKRGSRYRVLWRDEGKQRSKTVETLEEALIVQRAALDAKASRAAERVHERRRQEDELRRRRAAARPGLAEAHSFTCAAIAACEQMQGNGLTTSNAALLSLCWARESLEELLDRLADGDEGLHGKHP